MKITSTPNEPLSLTTEGDLSLYFIGCGSAYAKTLNQNNLLVTKGDDHLLIDCGSTCSRALHQAGVSMAQIRNYLITHSHADHIGGLEEVQLSGGITHSLLIHTMPALQSLRSVHSLPSQAPPAHKS